MCRMIKIVLIIQVSVLVLLALSEGRSLKCLSHASMPDENELQRQYRDWSSQAHYHDSFQLITQNNYNVPSDENHHRRIGHLFGDRGCQATLPNDTNSIMDKSTCPYYVNIFYNQHRYPQYMATARCKCSNCYDNNGTQPETDGGKRLLRTKCVEIPYIFKVLKQEFSNEGHPLCDNGTVYRYRNTYETISIGCTCAITQDKHVFQKKLRTP